MSKSRRSDPAGHFDGKVLGLSFVVDGCGGRE